MSKRGLPEQNVQYRGKKKTQQNETLKTQTHVHVCACHGHAYTRGTGYLETPFNMMQSNATQPIVIKMRLQTRCIVGL